MATVWEVAKRAVRVAGKGGVLGPRQEGRAERPYWASVRARED